MVKLNHIHTFAIDSYAKEIQRLNSIEDFKALAQYSQSQQLPLLLVGQGSNLLFVENFEGIIALNQLKGIQHQEDEQYHYLHVAGGENWHHLVEWTLANNMPGLENLALIPGCAGTAPIQNIGAYGMEFKDVCDYVEALNLTTGEIQRFSKEECQFGYRDSIFKHQYKDGFVIVAVGLKLAKNWQAKVQYGGLNTLAEEERTPMKIFEQVCQIRQSKLPDPKQTGNAGSFFKNPVISAEKYASLQQLYPTMPAYPLANGEVKLAAGWLIDQCGLKGYQIGGAMVHPKQALVLINYAQATAQDVVALAKYVRQRVAEKFGVYLEPEVRFIGAKGEVDAVATIA